MNKKQIEKMGIDSVKGMLAKAFKEGYRAQQYVGLQVQIWRAKKEASSLASLGHGAEVEKMIDVVKLLQKAIEKTREATNEED